MDDLRKSISVCKVSFKKIIGIPRLYVAFLWFVFLIGFIIMIIRTFCISTGIKSAPWLLPLLTEETGNQMFIIIGAIILFCDAPFLNANSGWQILRAGRKNWYWGNMLYIWLLSLAYAVILGIIPIILMLPHVEWMSGWGKILGSLAQTSAAAQLGIKNLNYYIMAQYTPIRAMILTIIPIWLNTVLIGVVNYAFNLVIRRGAGMAISVILGLSPLLMTRLANFAIGYYVAPPLWMSLAYYSKDGYGYYPSFEYVYGVLLGVIGVCMLLAFWGIKKMDLNTVEEI